MNHVPAADSDILLAAGSLANRIDVEVAGFPGSGRTYFLERVANLLANDGCQVLKIAAIPMPDPFPMSAVVGLDEVRPNNRGRIDPYASLTALVNRLNEVGHAVIVVDNSDWLDETSMRVLLAARQRTNTPIIAASDVRLAPGRKGLLEYLNPQIRLQTRFFQHDEIHQVLRGYLGASIEPQSLSVIANLAGGLPGLALAITKNVQFNGAFRTEQDIITLELPAWDAILKGVGGEYLLGLPERERTALRALSNCTDTSIERVSGMPIWEHLPILERRGLVEVIDVDGAPEIAVFPPAIRESLRGDLGPIASSVQLHAQMMPGDQPTSPGLLLADASTSEYSDSADSARNAVLLSHRQRMQLYHEAQTLRRKWEKNSSSENALRYVQALVGMAAPVETIKHVLAATDPNDDLQYGLYLVAWRASFTAIVNNDPKSAQDLIAEMKQRRPELEGGYRAIESHIQLITKSVPDDGLLRVAEGEGNSLGNMFLYLCQAEAELAKGNQKKAMKALERADHPEFNMDRIGGTLRSIALLHEGKIHEALASATLQHEESWKSPGRLWAESPAYVKALLLSYTGRVSEFDHHMTVVAATASTASLNVNQFAATYTLASVFAQQRGLVDKARSYAQQALSIGFAPSVYPGIPATVAEALAEGDVETAFDIVWREVEVRLARGYTSAAIMLGTFTLGYQPDVKRAERLMAAAEKTESVFLKLLADYGVAASVGEGDELMRISERFLELGFNCYAVQAAVIAAIRLYRQGTVGEAVKSIEKAWVIVTTKCEDLTTMLTPFIEEVGLTAREIEVTALLNSDQTNQQLADRLFVSVRTIEQHILRAKTKLGFADREELTRAATTWLAPFVPRNASVPGGLTAGEAENRERA